MNYSTIIRIGFWCGVGLSMLAPAVAANPESVTTLSASGVYRIQLAPQRVRIAIPLYAQTLSANESLEMIRERKENAKQRVLALSCLPDTIRFGGLTVEDSSMDDHYSPSALRMLGARGQAIDVADLPVLVTVRADMTADWMLPEGADEEAIFGIVQRIVAELKMPDVTGKEDRPEFSPKIEEALSALQNQSRSYTTNINGANPDQIRYAFVAAVTAEDEQRVLGGAFKDAKSQIDALADAAGVEVGTPIMVNSSGNWNVNGNAIQRSYNGRSRPEILQAGDREVISPIISELEFLGRVQVQFRVEATP
jgi:hypothetical protein